MGTTTRARLLRCGIAGALAVAVCLGSASVHAAELGDTVWIPMVDPAKGVDATIEENALGIIREGDGSDADWRIFRGKYRGSVSRHDFFITVGRPDLARRQSSRQSRHTLLVVGGLVALVAGVWVVGAGVEKGGWDPPVWVGAAMIAGGFITYQWVSEVFAGPDLSADEADGLVRRYNERLLERLKEPADRDNRIQALQLVRSLRLAPWIAPGSCGLAVAARF